MSEYPMSSDMMSRMFGRVAACEMTARDNAIRMHHFKKRMFTLLLMNGMSGSMSIKCCSVKKEVVGS